MNCAIASKVTAEHLKRSAYLYVRQSTLRQVIENTESTRRQYELRRRAVALGWPDESVVTVDCDLGQSGASAADRAGFQKLVAEVSMHRVGIVLGLEVSRLARNCADWHRLLELCAYTRTLILDEDGLYDPTQFNDRLLLGLKGTMSEAELHVLHSRLRGGILNKARRAELRTKLPIGFVYDARQRVDIDPDRQVRQSLELFFSTFIRLGSASATVRWLHQHKILFPSRVNGGARHGEIVWNWLSEQHAVQMLHNPRYAGAYAFGRYRHSKHPDAASSTQRLERADWIALVHDAHPGYISWQQFEDIQQMIARSAKAYGLERHHGPAREGPALLQGRVLCGRCGSGMSVRYHRRGGQLLPDYLCMNRGPTVADSPCQIVAGGSIDEAIGKLVLDSIQPSALELSMAVQHELAKRLEQTDRQRRGHVERARYEADAARRRYMMLDPNNRLVADALEADWNQKLRDLEQAQLDYERAREQDGLVLDEQARTRIENLAEQLPALWNDPQTPALQRKRVLGLLVQDVTLLKHKSDHVTAHVLFRAGATRTLHIPIGLTQTRRTDPAVMQKIQELLEEHPEGEVARILNEHQLRSGAHLPFKRQTIQWLLYAHDVKTHKQRLRERGMLTTDELCERLGVSRDTLMKWRREGRLRCRVCNDRGEWMFEPPNKRVKMLPKHDGASRLTSTAGSAL